MNRRDFLKKSILGTSSLLLPDYLLGNENFLNDLNNNTCKVDSNNLFDEDFLKNEENIKDSLNMSFTHKKTLTDIFVQENEIALFDSTFLKVKKVLKTVGYGNFNFISLDNSFKYVKFSKDEKNLLTKLFEFDAKEYGFKGKKVITNITNKINRNDIKYIKGTGHYLFKNVEKTYLEMIKKGIETDPSIKPILTSGVRNIVKQLYLFMNKTRKVNYNLSKASKYLAPPGHSYHGISDFDVGRKGYGSLNFESDFEKTEEFQTLTKLGYLQLRYGKNNNQGVIYEPWHVKVDLNKS